jgi:hypothetical protein
MSAVVARTRGSRVTRTSSTFMTGSTRTLAVGSLFAREEASLFLGGSRPRVRAVPEARQVVRLARLGGDAQVPKERRPSTASSWPESAPASTVTTTGVARRGFYRERPPMVSVALLLLGLHAEAVFDRSASRRATDIHRPTSRAYLFVPRARSRGPGSRLTRAPGRRDLGS